VIDDPDETIPIGPVVLMANPPAVLVIEWSIAVDENPALNEFKTRLPD
jgi:hypothetical protein